MEEHYDVIIIGAGLSGVCAALASSRTGAKTLLVEKSGYPGGMATGAWVHSMLTFHGKKGHKIIGGIPEEIIQNLISIGGSHGHIRDTIGVAYSVTPNNPDKLKYILLKLLSNSNTSLLFNTQFIHPFVEMDRIKKVILENSRGSFKISGKIFIDASGEGILASRCGNDFEYGRNGKVQPITLIFKVRNVDMRNLVDNILQDKDNFHGETLFDALKITPCLGVSGFFSQWKKGKLNVPRDRILFYQTMEEDEVGINTTRINNLDPSDPLDLIYAEKEGRRQMYEIFNFLLEKIPGFKNARLTGEAPLLGVREVRRIKGKYILSDDDLSSGRRFPDEVALGGFPVDIHRPEGSGIESREVGGEGFYGIPYFSLVAEKISNLLITGKCFSATFCAHASARVQATVMAMGQAVGTAAALSSREGIEPAELSIDKLREQLIRDNVILEPADPLPLPGENL
ncbi:MAG TPA: FAD-dependent oxidoreductase [Candidatus Eremiobacteraeota bacterium]|nr:MAG: hypothetical protein BWY64_00553 [bacterium ADurb.Bin363]HPZ06844.1 FAD-dependent oxidoreductase [Candidatus Eremiobacteraeota bacterium]